VYIHYEDSTERALVWQLCAQAKELSTIEKALLPMVLHACVFLSVCKLHESYYPL
jgi:cell division protein FtsL